jgi:hypothetical protein
MRRSLARDQAAGMRKYPDIKTSRHRREVEIKRGRSCVVIERCGILLITAAPVDDRRTSKTHQEIAVYYLLRNYMMII